MLLILAIGFLVFGAAAGALYYGTAADNSPDCRWAAGKQRP